MCKKDIYNLRLSNVTHQGNLNLVSLNADKSEYTVQIPESIRRKGKCTLTVSDIHIQVKNNNGTSIVPANSHTALVECEGLNLLGFSNQNASNPVCLGVMSIDSNKNDIVLDGPTSPVFTCLDIAPTLTIKRLVYNPASPFLPVAMNAQTAFVVPMIVNLQLEFFEDM